MKRIVLAGGSIYLGVTATGTVEMTVVHIDEERRMRQAVIEIEPEEARMLGDLLAVMSDSAEIASLPETR